MTFQQLYEQKLTSPETIAAQIQAGWHGFLDAPLSQPPRLIQAIEQRTKDGKSFLSPQLYRAKKSLSQKMKASVREPIWKVSHS